MTRTTTNDEELVTRMGTRENQENDNDKDYNKIEDKDKRQGQKQVKRTTIRSRVIDKGQGQLKRTSEDDKATEKGSVRLADKIDSPQKRQMTKNEDK